MGHQLRRHVISAEADLALERWTIAAQAGTPRAFPIDSGVSLEQFLRYAEFHGVIGLLHDRVGSAHPDCLPAPAWTDALVAAARIEAARELLLRQEFGDVLTAASRCGLRPLVLKGAALAYLVYPEPNQRGRVDTDLLIAPEDKSAMCALLEELQYAGDLIAAEHWATSERTFTKTIAGVDCRLDIHWRINNSPLFWHEELDYAYLLKGSQPVPGLHRDARCPGMAALLVHACIHRASHSGAPMFFDGEAFIVSNRLNWLYDIHILSAAMTEDDWTRFLASAGTIGLLGICHAAFEAASERFGTVIPPRVVERLGRRNRERASELLDGSAWHMRLMEFRALPSIEARWGWLREHLLPHRAYMRAKYPLNSRAPLALLHLKRLLQSRRTSSIS